MTDFDVDEPVPPIKRNRGQDAQATDMILSVTGVMLAAFAAFFPWYVFFNKEDFEVRGSGGHLVRDLPEAPFRNVVSISPIGSKDNDRRSSPPESVDDVVTATVPENTSAVDRKPHKPSALDQPLPGGTGFRLLHATAAQALIQDDSGMYIVQIGDVLPDNSRLSTIEKRDGKWALITSAGEIIR